VGNHVNKQTMYTVQTSTNESRAHFSPEPPQGHSVH